ncbi:FlgK family flagellar hook-associated protein [Jannaschia ovalis]|uniref:Flagellar hook-associated protein 1 n=1 Tax=Jannaschia ovalis TaxID=3038773 RepID=A0ABY8L8N7_9RHOB|nr:flagellar basal body rod C-terminal domain-containing protein [Jannaschia sp. GRR-S6-38]WGH77723.1 flagellar basal body rod C-terminal domain-containing protein [Jannaschia sp. GRR-S6-38]
MSLSSSLNNAVSGLGAASRRAETLSGNVAGADRPGYLLREAVPGPAGRDLTIRRVRDPGLAQMRRDAQAGAAAAERDRDFQLRLDAALGDPDRPGTLQDRLARLDAALVQAAGNPSAASFLESALRDADALTAEVNALGRLVAAERSTAETTIEDTVIRLNTDLEAVARLNADIMRLGNRGGDAADLLDRRDLLIDRISLQIPLRTLPREGGAVALVSRGGVMLLDARPARIEFSARALVTPEMELGAGLSGLTIDGREMIRGDDRSRIAGGGLEALFMLRDDTAPRAGARLDAFAAELVSRFAQPAVDPTLGVGQPGLFTDAGAAFDPAALAGLAGRMALNPLLDPEDPATHWRLREGLGAALPGPAGRSDQLLRLGAALRSPQAPATTGLTGRSLGFVDLAATLRSAVSADRLRAEDATETRQVQAADLAARKDGGAVDIDAEMQRLIEVEQAYAANARVIQVVGDMIQRLTEI